VNDSSPPVPRPLWARLARHLLIAVAVFLVLCGLSAVAVPLLIDHVVLARLGESIGRQITIERIRFNPFTLALSTRGIRVSDQEAAVDGVAGGGVAGDAVARDFVTVADLRADLSISSVWYLAPVIDGLKITAPIINLRRSAEQRFNFSDIVDRLPAAPADVQADREPTRFALHNLELTGGEIRLDDRFLQQQHRVSELQIGVPFISNLDYATAITVQPALSALVNDSPLSLAGVSVPFSETRETTLDVALRDFDIATYLRLSPVPLAFTVSKGRLGTNLKIHFAQEAGVNKLGISGTSRIDDLQIDARDGPRLVSAKRVELGLERLEPLTGRYGFGALDVDGLDIEIERQADGAFPLVRAFTVAQEKRTDTASDVDWSIRKTNLEGGRVAFKDRTVTPAVELVHSDIGIQMAEIGNRQAQAAAGSLSLKQNESSRLSWQGEIDIARSRAGGHLDATVASIASYLPYLAGVVNGGLQTGALAAQGDLELGWADGFTLEAVDAQASVENARLMLPDDKKPAVAFGRLAAQGVAVSLTQRRAEVARVELDGANIQVERDAKGNLNLQRITAPAQTEKPAASNGDRIDRKPAGNEPPARGAEQSPTPWMLKVDRIDLARNEVNWQDLSAPKPVNLPITQLAGTIEQIGTDLSATSRVDLTARIGDAGAVTARGDFVVAPWSMQLAVQLQRLALASLDPYLAQRLTLSIDEGALSANGQLRVGDDRVGYSGRLEVDGLRSRERTTSTQTIRWKKLLLDGIDIDVHPAALGPQDRIVVGGITLSDFFARVRLSEEGRFNLQDIVRTESSAQAQARAQARGKAATAGSIPGRPADAEEGARSAPPVQPSTARTAAAPAAPAASAAPATSAARTGPTIRLGAIKLERGASNFTDRFVRPNYSVNLTELNGGLSAMASDSPTPANVGLTGRVDGNAPIEISGKINPFGPTLYTDIHAEAKGIDLPTLTPYSAKYAGYAIEKGKLSLDVHYRIENEQLEAQNRVFLDQLTFGEKIDSPDATSLPIQFALSLLKNGNGEIDVSLPISGSLDDPQFSIGSIIGKAILNLLTRVITSPFSALASAFGGSAEELSFVEFRPGTASLTEDSVKRLQTMAKALVERPALKLEIAGRVDPESEKDAIERQRLEARLKALKRRQTGDDDAPAAQDRQGKQDPQAQDPQAQDPQAQARQAQLRQEEAAVSSGVTISSDEYPVLLKQLYDDTKLPDKPRNALGLPRRLEVAEMEKLLLGAIQVDTESVRRLAMRRSQVIRQWLAKQGRISEDRMFMLAPRTSPDMTGPNQSRPQCPASCAEFSLR
jgi:uncharacterized protein involved in outer membrane biogenesis